MGVFCSMITDTELSDFDQKKDAHFLFNLMNMRKVRHYFASPGGFSYADHLRFLENYKGKILIVRKGKRKIGVLRHRAIDNEITIAIHPDYWGQGIATQLLKKYCRNRKGLKAEINPLNIGSIKAYQNAGFRISYYVLKKI